MMQPVEQPAITPWRPWEAIPVALAALCTLFLVQVMLAALGTSAAQIGPPSGVVLGAAFFAFSAAWVSLRHRQGLGALGFRTSRAAGDLATGAWFGAALFGTMVFAVLPLIVTIWTLVSGGSPEEIDQPIIPFNPSVFEAVLGGVAAVVAAPIGEEVFFRGFLFGSLRGRLGFLRAAAISGAVFGIFHIQPLLMIVMFFVGVALAWLYEWRRSLVASIGAHAMFNVIGYTLILWDRV